MGYLSSAPGFVLQAGGEREPGGYQILSARGIRKVILVTSAMHMPRAAAAFRKAGFAVTPSPGDFRTGWGEGGPFDRFLPSLNSMEDSERTLHEWLGLWAYRLRGWA